MYASITISKLIYFILLVVGFVSFFFLNQKLIKSQIAPRFSLLPIAGDLREFSLLIKVRVGAELPDQLTFSTGSINNKRILEFERVLPID